ncbi:hypothetical protein [Archangium primigenium]|uniref:hypothetical protein n=1 Tax=[Archangium] primigenium TaxID=2792470 RepID=UPI0023BAFC7D|nr:hypothetical protein [Archangium primigenium]
MKNEHGWMALTLSLCLAGCGSAESKKTCEEAPEQEHCAKPEEKAYSLSLEAPGAVRAGVDLRVRWSAPKDHPESDWVGVFRAGEEGAPHQERQTVPPGATGTLLFSGPAKAGAYELRYVSGAEGEAKHTVITGFTVVVPPSHVFLFSNHDGGSYTLEVDQDLPNIQIGILSAKPSQVTLKGAYVGNVEGVRLVGESVSDSSVTGVSASKVQKAALEPVKLGHPYAPSTLVCATGARTLTWPGTGCNTTTQVEEYFLSKFGEVPVVSHLSQEGAFSGHLALSHVRLRPVIVRDTTAFNVAAAVGAPEVPVQVRVEINATVGSLDARVPAFTTGLLAEGSSVHIHNYASIFGAGGAGGSGGNGGKGFFERTCSRAGAPGGTAIHLTVPAVLDNQGSIWGGGGGGGGASGCGLNAGGGGGAGFVGGLGGAAASAFGLRDELAFCGQDEGVRTGLVGEPGGLEGGKGGKAGDLRKDGSYTLLAGDGGGYGQPGQSSSACVYVSPGGAAGASIRRGPHAVRLMKGPLPDGTYDVGFGPLRGPVAP